MTDFTYPGSELDLFAAVDNWKTYWSRRMRPYVRGDVLEVGAGIGSNTRYLDPGNCRRWVCLEPDAKLSGYLYGNMRRAPERENYEVVTGTIQNLDPDSLFDTILYIDVLEHIEDDREELRNAASRLRSDGRLIVLSPAHRWLFTPFDAAIGHFRRYNRPMLRQISPPELSLEQMAYLDSAGLLLSSANRMLLRQSMPTKAQLRIWDQYLIPISRIADRIFFDSLGKSIFAIWHK